MTVHPHPLLVVPRRSAWAAELGLPAEEDNLFQRVIRNPRVDAPLPRERECTEMLCAVLRNTQRLRNGILSWLGRLLGADVDAGALELTIDTEGDIHGKRDDLRIVGWRTSPNSATPAILWTIEVKVGASFHQSTALETGSENEDAAWVNQIENYDAWLHMQSAEQPAGFVLALEDATHLLPREKLRCSWRCASWTMLGRCVESLLRDDRLEGVELFLAKHLLGFIRTHLWRSTEMADFRLEFDDVALLRAFAVLGKDCENKINLLVQSLEGLLRQDALGCGAWNHQARLFAPSQRSILWQSLFDPLSSQPPYLMAGVQQSDLTLWIETSARFEQKAHVRNAIQAALPALQTKNPLWRMPDGGVIELELRQPLERLLSAADPTPAFQQFFQRAFADLREVGVVEAIRRAREQKS